MYVKHPLIKANVLEKRKYQEEIVSKARKSNLMVVLPTGMGKTPIAVVLAAQRLEKHPGSKIMMLAPTKPLAGQHEKTFRQFLTADESEFQVVTGVIKPAEREKLYKEKRFIFATPQTIKNDVEKGRFSFRGFSLLIIDEIHHGVGRYAYPFLAKVYRDESKHPRILGLTASPSSERQKIEEICSNCGIDEIEIKTEVDEDVSPYVKKRLMGWIEVELPESFLKIRQNLEEAYQQKLGLLRKWGFLKTKRTTKKQLLSLQNNLFQAAKKGYKKAFIGLSAVSQAIKLEHAITLLETQGITSLEEYFRKLRSDKKAKKLIENQYVSNAMYLSRQLWEKGARHPKISKLCSIVNTALSENKDVKIIVFANYREMVKQIVSVLKNVSGARPVEFIGQKGGLSQKEQMERLEEFRLDVHNILVGTSIGEEGLDIPAVDAAIFYEPVPSEIRSIQRRGRVGRQTVGKVVILITKNTRDEAYYWAAKHKEKRMKSVLYGMKSPTSSTNLKQFR